MISEIIRFFIDPDLFFIKYLRRQGAKVGENVQIVDRFKFKYEKWNANLITIGNGVVISSGVRLVTHDSSYSNVFEDLPVKMGKIIIEDNVYIGVDSIILPGVRIGSHSIIGAGSLINSDVPPYSIFAGVPGKHCGTTNQGLEKFQSRINVYSPLTFYLDFGGSQRQLKIKFKNKYKKRVFAIYKSYMNKINK